MSRAMQIISELMEKNVSINAISLEIGYSRPAVSRYVSASYGAGVEKIEAAILARYDRRECPHMGQEVNPETCRRKALAPRPFGGQARERHWLACQTCPHKPAQEN